MRKSVKIVLSFTFVISIGLVVLIVLFDQGRIYQRPDLIPEDLKIEAMDATSITVFWKFKNIGNEIVPLEHNKESINLAVYVSRDTIIRDTGDSLGISIELNNDQIDLAPGESLKGSIVIIVNNDMDQYKYLMMEIDPEDILNESNEDNNKGYLDFSYKPVEIEITEETTEEILLDTISFDHFLELFDKELPKICTFKTAVEGQNLYLTCPEISNKVVLFENGKILPRLRGFAYAYKPMDDDILWITYRSHVGEYGASEQFYLSVINRKECIISKTFELASSFGEDGFFNHTSGEFINDSSYQFKRVWNDENYKTDSTSGIYIIK